MTHEQYLQEPRQVIDWALAFAGMEREIDAEAIKETNKKNGR